MGSIKRLFLTLGTVGMVSASAWAGLNLCDAGICKIQTNLPKLDWTGAANLIPGACTALVGDNGQYVYVSDERRHVCYQAAGGDNALKFDFSVHRNKGDADQAYGLDYHSCVENMQTIVSNGVYCGSGDYLQQFNVGSRIQVGLFDVYVSANPGLCAGMLPYSV